VGDRVLQTPQRMGHIFLFKLEMQNTLKFTIKVHSGGSGVS
jgi:hypothetical protein